MIAVVDYCKGNLKSVERGLIAAGGDALITEDPSVIAQADAVVLPGVGAFADASATMVATGQMDAVRAAIASGTPFLGICLGEHLLFDAGVECAHGPGRDGVPSDDDLPEGLGVIPGIAVRMPQTDAAGAVYKIPHVGWNSLEFEEGCNPLLEGIAPGEYFYFTHSYIAPASSATFATTTHSITFPAAVQRGNAFGVQFHPEKSSDAGARVLRNFVGLVRSRA